MVTLKRADGTLSRTARVNALVMALGTLVGMMPQLQHAIPEWIYPWVLVALSVLYQYLRSTTTQGLDNA